MSKSKKSVAETGGVLSSKIRIALCLSVAGDLTTPAQAADQTREVNVGG